MFNNAEFASAGPLPEEQLRAYYNTNLARFPAPPEPAAPTPTPAVGGDNFAKVRPQVEAALRNELATRIAVKAANDFTVALYERKATANSAELAAFLSSQNRTAMALEPFSPENPPATMPWLAYYGEQISRLEKDHFFSDPLPLPQNGAVVLLWNDTLPSYQPALMEVREKVAAAYKENEKSIRFAAQGQMLQAKLGAAVKAGTPFEKAAADAKLEVKSFANFTMQDTPKDLPRAARSALQTLKPGEISGMISDNGKGYLVYAAQKQLPELSPANPRFAEIRKGIMSEISNSTNYALLAGMVKAELDKTAPPAVATAK